MNPNLAALSKIANRRVVNKQDSDTFASDRTPCVIQTSQIHDEDLPRIGSILGKYELVSRLGEGTSSVVFKAIHRKLLVPVAVKILRKAALCTAPQLLTQLTSEAVLLARLNHPHVVRLWDLDDEGEYPYLVTEFIEGRTLVETLAHCKRLPPDLAFALVRQTVEGLAAAHTAGIIHRDVKPSNILIDKQLVVKVADLGQAGLVEQTLTQVAAVPTIAIGLVGAVAYLAPEQAQNPDHVDHRADMYSVGVTLYQAVTGVLPFEAKSAMQMIMKHVHEIPIEPIRRVPELTESMNEIIMQLLAKNPDDRFRTYEELRVALAQAVGDRRAPRALAQSFLTFMPPG